jgi:hypothetical protein
MTDDNGQPIENRYTNQNEAFNGMEYTRSGLKTLNIALKWGILDNDIDNSDPSWVVGFEYRVPVVSSIDYYDIDKLNKISHRQAPEGTPYTSTDVVNLLNGKIDLSDSSMGDGVHWLNLHTELSKRYSFVSPVFQFWYEKSFVFGNSIFKTHENREYYKPGDKFGFLVAVDFIPWERYTRDPVTDEKNVLADFSISLGANFYHQMKGMMMSEISDFIALPTVVDEYSTLSGYLNLSFMPTKYVRFTTGLKAGYITDHVITDQPKGVDHSKNNKIEAGEYDPMYENNKIQFNSLNSIGARVIATETLLFSAYFNLAIQF